MIIFIQLFSIQIFSPSSHSVRVKSLNCFGICLIIIGYRSIVCEKRCVKIFICIFNLWYWVIYTVVTIFINCSSTILSCNSCILVGKSTNCGLYCWYMHLNYVILQRTIELYISNKTYNLRVYLYCVYFINSTV